MNKIFYLLVLISSQLSAQTYMGPIARPTAGYGASGPYSVSQLTMPNPMHTQQCEIFYPTGKATPSPTILFMHGFSGNYSIAYKAFFDHMVSLGYAVVFAPYPATTLVQNNYQIMRTGFTQAARNFSNIIDTTQVGLVGYSFGGGAAWYMADELLTKLGWGSAGRFVSTIAPWYSDQLTNAQLAALPSDVKMQSFILEEDIVCDHRQAIEIYNNTPSIQVSEKDVVYVPSSTVSGYDYVADHYCFVSNQFVNNFDALDAYVFNRLIAALADYTYTGNLTAKNIALGEGSLDQISLPTGLNPLEVEVVPVPKRPSSSYVWPCDSMVNPRHIYCDSVTSVTDLSSAESTLVRSISLERHTYGVVVDIELNTSTSLDVLSVYNIQGSLIKKIPVKGTHIHAELDVSSGLYLIRIAHEVHKILL